ncbi:MAG: integrin alpha [Pseudomonadota bacterium]
MSNKSKPSNTMVARTLYQVTASLCGLALLSTSAALAADEGWPAEFLLSDLRPVAGGDGTRGTIFVGPFEGQQIGYTLSSAGDVNGDGLSDLILGAPLDRMGTGQGDIGFAFVIFGRSEPIEPIFDLANLLPGRGDGSRGFVLRGAFAEGEAGSDVASAGDLNGDGFDDLLIGTRHNLSQSPFGGEVFVLFGRADGFAPLIDLKDLLTVGGGDGSEGFVLRGRLEPGAYFGSAIAGNCDVNGDGIGDFIVGAPGSEAPDGDSFARGVVFVVFGREESFGAEFWTDRLYPEFGGDGSEGFAILGPSFFDALGTDVACAGDVNGDGIDDVAMTAALGLEPADRSGPGKGFIVFGRRDVGEPVIDTIDLYGINGGDGSIGTVIHGQPNTIDAIADVVSAGDANGDGVGDLLFDNSLINGGIGEVYLVFGSAGGLPSDIFVESFSPFEGGDGSRGVLVGTLEDGQGEGDISALIGARGAGGDLNGDGISDVLVSAIGDDGPGGADAGATYVIFGLTDWPSIAPVDRLLAENGGDGGEGFVVYGIDPDDSSGRAMAVLQDFNGDGRPDLAVSAGGADRGTRENTGEVYVLFGPPIP